MPPPTAPLPGKKNWPAPLVPQTAIAAITPSYLYGEYADDQNLQALVQAQNSITQAYLNWFNTLNLPVYTKLSGALLDWVGQGIYGMPRPTLASGGSRATGAINSLRINALVINGYHASSGTTIFMTSDDVYQRVLTWHFYKGDGKTFSIPWLKRRIMRFLFGTHGTDYIVNVTTNVSVTFTTGSQVAITLTNSGMIGMVFLQGVQQGVLELPFQLTFTVTVSS